MRENRQGQLVSFADRSGADQLITVKLMLERSSRQARASPFLAARPKILSLSDAPLWTWSMNFDQQQGLAAARSRAEAVLMALGLELMAKEGVPALKPSGKERFTMSVCEKQTGQGQRAGAAETIRGEGES